jgi:hypothetical protein
VAAREAALEAGGGEFSGQGSDEFDED